MPDLRILIADDAFEFVALRRQALVTDPDAFAERPDTDSASRVDFVRQRLAEDSVESGSVVLGVFDSRLIGVVGVHRTSAGAARLWGLYVAPTSRKAGIGRTLLDAAIRLAEQMAGVLLVELSVSESSAAAIRLYERVGFRAEGAQESMKRRMVMDLCRAPC